MHFFNEIYKYSPLTFAEPITPNCCWCMWWFCNDNTSIFINSEAKIWSMPTKSDERFAGVLVTVELDESKWIEFVAMIGTVGITDEVTESDVKCDECDGVAAL